jgi:hypothetical protein
MKSDLTWTDGGSRLVCVNSGAASAEEFISLIERVASMPGLGSHLEALIDHTDLDVTKLTADGIERIAATWIRLFARVSVRAAFVVGSDSPSRYGLTRMFEANVAPRSDFEIRVFEKRDEAMAWLVAGDPRPTLPA